MAERVRRPGTGPLPLPLAAPVAILAVLLAPPARAEWKVSPLVDLRETYSDNVQLGADNASRGQFLTELSPSLTIANTNPRLKLSTAIREHLYAYSGERLAGTNSSSLDLQANARAKLIEDLLFLDAAASIAQQSISAFGPPVANNGYSSANRAQIRTYSLAPYVTHQFGTFASSVVRYTHNSVSSSNAAFGNSTADNVSFSLASGRKFNTLGWNVQANRQQIDDSLTRKTSSMVASAGLRWRIGPQLALTANAGYDKYDYNALGNTSGASRSVGFSWSPSLRTSVDASVGKHFFGATHSLHAVHRSRRSVWDIVYTDGITTTRDQFLLPATIDTVSLLDRLFTPNIADPVARRQAVDAYIRAANLPPSLADSINFLSNRYLRQKQFRMSAGFNSSRSTAVVSLNATRGNALSSQQADSALLGSNLATLNDDIRQLIATAAASYRLSPRSAVNASLSRSRSESLSTGIKGNQTSLSVAMTQQFSRKLSGAVELRRNQGNTSAAAARTYRENAVSASLSLKL